MFLKNISLKNVRCIEDAEISFETDHRNHRKWTLLVGDNGTGKSTVLKAISLLMCGSEALLDVLHAPGSWVRNGAEECVISGELTTARGEVRKISLTLRPGQSLRQMLKDNAKSLKRLDDALEHTNRSYLTIGYGASRHTDEGGGLYDEVFHHPRVRGVSTLFADHARMISLESWAMELYHNPNHDGLGMVRDTLQGLLPNVTFKKFDSRTKALIFDTPDGPVPLKSLSGGYRSVVGFCGDLLYRITEIFQDYQNPLKARGLLLIDEMGLHLHPVWQRMLVEFLTEKLPNFQIIATTNAPLTAHQAGEGELYYLRRHGVKKPPTLHQFEGDPSKLLLHQLILSPVFGLDTANSRGVERDRKEHDSLRSKSRKTAKDKERMRNLSERLAEVSKWDEVALPEQEKLSSLLAKIDRTLSSKTDG